VGGHNIIYMCVRSIDFASFDWILCSDSVELFVIHFIVHFFVMFCWVYGKYVNKIILYGNNLTAGTQTIALYVWSCMITCNVYVFLFGVVEVGKGIVVATNGHCLL